jgi:hypothetical protein
MEDNELIRLRAYEIWIREGQPEGRELEHWLQARREVLGDRDDNPSPQGEELKQSTQLG